MPYDPNDHQVIARRMLVAEVDVLARALRTMPSLANGARREMEQGGMPRVGVLASCARTIAESQAKIEMLCQVLAPLGESTLAGILAGLETP